MNIKNASKEKYLLEHERLSRLFVEDRFKFELERKMVIEQTINQCKEEERKHKLIKLQEKWDGILRNSGSGHNRFVLIQMLFWDQVNNSFKPALKTISRLTRQ